MIFFWQRPHFFRAQSPVVVLGFSGLQLPFTSTFSSTWCQHEKNHGIWGCWIYFLYFLDPYPCHPFFEHCEFSNLLRCAQLLISINSNDLFLRCLEPSIFPSNARKVAICWVSHLRWSFPENSIFFGPC